MAVKKVIEIDVDVLNAQGGLDKFVSTLAETEKQSVSLKTELRQLKQQLAELPEGTAEYDKIAKRAGEVSDQIGDINTKVKNLGSDTKGIDAIVQGAQTLSGAFSVASSASALLGDENEDLQKTMLKVEAAIGLTVGIQSIANALQKESALVLGAQSLATTIQTGLQYAYTTAVGTTTGALKLLKLALISTGIGAIVVLLGSLISALAESTDATKDQKVAQDNLNKSLDKTNELYKESLDSLKSVTEERILRAKIAGKGEKELLKIEQDAREERSRLYKQERDDLLRQLNDKNINLENTEKINKQLSLIQKEYFRDLENDRKKDLENELEVVEKQREARKKAIEEAIKKEQERRKDERKKQLDAINEQAKTIQENSQKIADEKLKKDIELKKKADEILKQIDAELAPEETPTQKLQREYEERLKILTDAGASTLALDAKYATDSFLLEQKLAADKKALKDKELEDEKALQAQKLNTLGVSFGKVSELLGKNSKAGKAFAISQALINTYQGITAELATKTATPFEFGVKLVNIASVVGIGFKAVKDILKTPEMSTGGGGSSAPSGGGGAGGTSAPTFNVVGNAGVNQIATTLGKEQPPVQAFVVSKQMTNQQEMDRNIVKNATL